MHPVLRIFGIIVVFVVSAIAWVTLAGITQSRTNTQTYEMEGQITELWGTPQVQRAPTMIFRWATEEPFVRTETKDGKAVEVRGVNRIDHELLRMPASTDINAQLKLDPRRKGLVWYALYDVEMSGAWTYRHDHPERGVLDVSFAFPDQQGIYDDFTFVINGVDRARELVPENGLVTARVPVNPGDVVSVGAGYKSRGRDEWRYSPTSSVSNLESFHVSVVTDFADIDFPAQTMSPSTKTQEGDGWRLDWDFSQVVTGYGVGMVMPQRVQPGELATELSFSAPISLFFFFLVIFMLSMMRGIEIHPINYALIAGAFFAFHLLFAYSADHLPVEQAFGLSSVVSVALVVSYLRLVVSSRFAFIEAAIAQLIYLVGFSLAHFFDGFTGLTVTVLSIATLFLLMQLTGRVRWTEALARSNEPAPRPTPPAAA